MFKLTKLTCTSAGNLRARTDRTEQSKNFQYLVAYTAPGKFITWQLLGSFKSFLLHTLVNDIDRDFSRQKPDIGSRQDGAQQELPVPGGLQSALQVHNITVC